MNVQGLDGSWHIKKSDTKLWGHDAAMTACGAVIVVKATGGGSALCSRCVSPSGRLNRLAAAYTKK